jgi:hypothetical protein
VTERDPAVRSALMEMTHYVPRRPGPLGRHVVTRRDLAEAAVIVWAEAVARGEEETAEGVLTWFFACFGRLE